MNNEATTYQQLVDPERLITIRRAARRANVDAEEACRQFMDCNTQDLSKTAADELIDYLQSLEAA